MNYENEFIKMLLEEDTNSIFRILYSKTVHKKMVLTVMNEIISEYPESYASIYYLNHYAVQKWAKTIREEYRIGLDYLLDCLEQTDSLKTEGFFGLTSYTRYQKHKECLENTEKIIDYIESNLKKKKYQLLCNIHACDNEVSHYTIKKYYKSELLDFCKQTNFEKFNTQTNIDLSMDESFAYHNTDVFLRNIKNIKKYALYGIGNDIDFQTIYDTLNLCIQSLLDFPYLEDIYIPVLAYSKGISETKTAIQTNKTRKYIRNKRVQGIEIISQILWGYGPK